MNSLVDRRQFLQLGMVGAAGLAGVGFASAEVDRAEVLPNGIRLSRPWPPRIADVPQEAELPPYLKEPPAVLPIDLGRQLFVDDFLIAQTTLKRSHHLPTYHARSPVLTGGMVFSDGVWYDPSDKTFKMWYLTKGGTGYAVSSDGLSWEKPKLDVRKGTNLVELSPRDSSTVWLDLNEKDPKRRFKMFRSYSRKEKKSWCLWVHFSADGIHWTEGQPTGACGDRSTVFFNPFRGVWVYSLRHGWGRPRRRRYWETRDDVVTGAQWGANSTPAMWTGSDRLDPPRPDYKVTPELYNLDGVAYESLLLGLFTIWRGQFPEREKPNEVCIGYSRDGWHWHRPDRRAFCPISEKRGDWNYANVQSAGGGCLVVGDKLYFYVSGRGTGHVTSLAVLRRDGFASMDAGDTAGSLTTRPVTFRGKHLFVNADAVNGELRAEVLDEKEKVIAPFSAANCNSVRADKTLQAITWQGADDLDRVAGKVVRFRFQVRKARLFAFWVSPERSGPSHGYVAAGGPGFTRPTDA